MKPETIETIKAVQRSVGVKDDGVAGPKTWAAIAQAVSAGSAVSCRAGVSPATEAVSPATPSPAPAAPPASPPPPAGETPALHQSGSPPLDPRTEVNIATLEPAAQNLARQFMELLAAHDITAKITSGRRTYTEQDALYEQGRTGAGKVVTNARGGYSNHNFGLAFDITVFDGAKPVYESPTYKVAGAIGKSIGLLWGGDWSNDDEPHFELRPEWARNLTENDALAQYRLHTSEGRALV